MLSETLPWQDAGKHVGYDSIGLNRTEGYYGI
jgi:hypothetical protein